MPDTHTPVPSVFSPLAKALLDGFSEGVVVFDPQGKVLYANAQAREALSGLESDEEDSQNLMPRLAAMGGRLRPLRIGALELGEAMFIPGIEGPTTLADRDPARHRAAGKAPQFRPAGERPDPAAVLQILALGQVAVPPGGDAGGQLAHL